MGQALSYGIQSVGLFADIIGAILLFRFGLPEIERTGGAQRLIRNQVDNDALAKEKRYDFWGRVGLLSLLVGFILQLIPNAVGWWVS